MSTLAGTSQLAERIRAAVACFRAVEGARGRVYVLLEAVATDLAETKLADRPGVRRLAARRIYAGEHKNLEGKWTVVVGHDLADSTAVAVPVQHRMFEVTVRATPFGVDVPFEGTFDLKSIEIEKHPG